MVWCIITKWTEQSEHLFSQESLDHTTHLVFIEILNFAKKKKKSGPLPSHLAFYYYHRDYYSHVVV